MLNGYSSFISLLDDNDYKSQKLTVEVFTNLEIALS